MAIDSLVANAGRLRILTALAAEDRLEFVRLRRATDLTDGNLSAHAKRLETAGLVGIEKHFRRGKPVTTFHLTDDGRRRLTAHVQALMAAVGQAVVAAAEPPSAPAVTASPVMAYADDEWVD